MPLFFTPKKIFYLNILLCLYVFLVRLNFDLATAAARYPDWITFPVMITLLYVTHRFVHNYSDKQEKVISYIGSYVWFVILFIGAVEVTLKIN